MRISGDAYGRVSYTDAEVAALSIGKKMNLGDSHQGSSTSFKKLEVQPQPTCSKTAVVVHLKNASVEVNDGASQQTIQAVLLALQNIC